jgi:hypothetical protein
MEIALSKWGALELNRRRLSGSTAVSNPEILKPPSYNSIKIIAQLFCFEVMFIVRKLW